VCQRALSGGSAPHRSAHLAIAAAIASGWSSGAW
jgi:hypothetical protein